MAWQEVLLAIIGSGVLTSIIVAFSERKKTGREADRIGAEADKIDAESEGVLTEHYDTYADRLENRIVKLEGRLDRMERRDMIFESAISCAYQCEVEKERCPVLVYIAQSKLPKKIEER